MMRPIGLIVLIALIFNRILIKIQMERGQFGVGTTIVPMINHSLLSLLTIDIYSWKSWLASPLLAYGPFEIEDRIAQGVSVTAPRFRTEHKTVVSCHRQIR